MSDRKQSLPTETQSQAWGEYFRSWLTVAVAWLLACILPGDVGVPRVLRMLGFVVAQRIASGQERPKVIKWLVRQMAK